jgi:hypothetical protein
MKEKEKGKRSIKISRIAIKCWEVIFVGTSCVISSFDDDLLDGCMKLVPL